MSRNGGNKQKDTLLGEPHGTACNRLRKMILFRYVQVAGADICHRCKQKIDSVSDLSIEHTDDWQRSENPRAVFFDLDRIAFSHLKCNMAAASHSQTDKHAHGNGAYNKRGCRCDECRKWKSGKNAMRIR